MSLSLLTPHLSLYIHFPWCVSKCPYCDFNSHTRQADWSEQPYVQALLGDIDLLAPSLAHRPLHSIFMGGGTPSLFSAQALDTLLRHIEHYWPLESVEITLEANPGSAEQQRFSDYRRIGINRLSLGIQSFNNTHLRQLGRIHSAQDALSAIDMVKRAGFSRFNLDIMYGLPGQSTQEALDDLQQAITLAPEHLSWYQLTLEPNTPFYHKPPPALPEDALIMEHMTQGQERLAQNNYLAYEVSAYAHNQHAWCQHNINYWLYGDYLGIGAGAHSKLTHASKVTRHHLTYHPKQYLRTPAAKRIENQHNIDADNRLFEYMLNHLRLKRRLDFYTLYQMTGHHQSSFAHILETLRAQSLIEYNQKYLLLTTRGEYFYNDVVTAFLPNATTN